MTVHDDYVAKLERDNDQLRERIALLEHEIGIRVEVPLEFLLTGQETLLFSLMLKREVVTKDMALTVLYGGRPVEAEAKIIDVFICKARKKLQPFGITIETVWGRGYRIPPESKAVVRKMLHLDDRAAQERA